jgi:hypothetical protein
LIDFNRLSSALDDNPALVRRARLAALTLVAKRGAHSVTVRIGDKIEVCDGARPDAALTLIASEETWMRFAQAVPPVGYQSLVGMQRMGTLRIEGDIVAWGRNLIFLEQVFAAVRPDAPPETIAPAGSPEIEPAVGRYLRMDFNGKPHRIYFEEAGQGIPLICLHTAGADGRQYRALLNDAGITSRFRVIVFDLPWHGKSSPPPASSAKPIA